jgi:glycosyltransferase involved in cell wall biosynthesis
VGNQRDRASAAPRPGVDGQRALFLRAGNLHVPEKRATRAGSLQNRIAVPGMPIPNLSSRTGATASVEDDAWGVNLVGWLTSSLGLGEAARSVIRALDARGVPLMPVHGFTFVPDSLQLESLPCVGPDSAPFPINLLHISPPALNPFLADAGASFARNRYTIGFWWWELSSLPREWMEALHLVDEVWVGSDYVAHNIQSVTTVPVIKTRIPVALPSIRYPRQRLGLPAGFLFLFIFDFHSAFERKNPLAVIEAFRRAFPAGAGTSLVIKCLNQESDPSNYARLCAAAHDQPDVHILAGYVPGDRKNALIAACDCYVSLHRAEGFGLTLAEAMYLGKPVVATRYSGNLEFMTDANSYLVDYKMTRIEQDCPPYPPGGEWAEPDVDHAAELLRHVVATPLDVERRAARGAAHMREAFSVRATGEIMRARLEAIREQIGKHSPIGRGRPLVRRGGEGARANELSGLRGSAGPPQRGSGTAVVGALRGLARKLARKLMRRIRARRDATIFGRRRTAVHVSGVLRELRRQDAALDELRGEVKALAQRVSGLDRARTGDPTERSRTEG